jgi:2-polyprenyl-3-methyl-5-hydroxy-6-metoxy-1,4-benzoquinol methylase
MDAAFVATEAKARTDSARLHGYLWRMQYLRELCRGKKVLHLGCSSGHFIRDRLQRGSLLHAVLHEEAAELYGVDIERESLVLMRDQLGFANLYEGNVERLDELQLDQRFDVVLAGDLIEHLTRPGAMLDGAKRFMQPGGRFVLSTVNAFGLHFQLRRWLGTYTEHPEHVCFYSPETIANLLERHGYVVQEMYGCYNEPPRTWKRRLEFAAGMPLFKWAPVLAGTLIAVATPSAA